MKRLKVGLAGLEGVGAAYLSALRAEDRFELLAVADANPETLRRHTESSSLAGYEDYRSLIVERVRDGLDLLFVALEPFQSLGFMELAARRGVGVFHKAPFARNVREGQKLLRMFDEAQCPLVVARLQPLSLGRESLLAPTERTRGSRRGVIPIPEGTYAVTADVRTTHEPSGWRGDSARAGGGVLLNGAYEQVDLLIRLFGLPESVYAQCAMARASRAACPHDTEDAVQVSLRFSGKRMGCITAWRGAAEPSWRVVFVAPDKTTELSGPCGTGFQPVGHTGCQPVSQEPQKAIASAIRTFGASQWDDAQPIESHAREHLPTLAVIEAAYLSAKTGQAESPGRFLM